MLKLLSFRDFYVITERRISRILIPDSFMRDVGLKKDLPLWFLSLLRTGESVQHGADIIEDISRLNGQPFFKLLCPFNLTTYFRRTFLCLNLNIRYLFRDHHGSAGLVAKAGFILHGLTSLHGFERGIVIYMKYRNAVLKLYVCLFRGAVRLRLFQWMTMSRVHRSYMIKGYLISEDIRNPDLQTSTLYRICSTFRASGTHNSPAVIIQCLKTAMFKEWVRLQQEVINYVIITCEAALISVRWDHNPY